jgi:hypothetical protein
LGGESLEERKDKGGDNVNLGQGVGNFAKDWSFVVFKEIPYVS